MDITELHRRAVENWVNRVDAVPEGAWDGSTPCTEWDVRTLVNHVVSEDLWTVPLVQGSTVTDIGDRYDGDNLGGDAKGAARAASVEALKAVGARGSTGEIVHLSFGDVPLEEYLWQLTADHLVHGWDLAAATGQDRSLDPELVEAVSGWYADREEMMRDYGVVGARVETATDDPAGRLLGAFGRSPDW